MNIYLEKIAQQVRGEDRRKKHAQANTITGAMIGAAAGTAAYRGGTGWRGTGKYLAPMLGTAIGGEIGHKIRTDRK